MILVTGGDGVLASYLNKYNDVCALPSVKLDITSRLLLHTLQDIQDTQPIECIINTAAITDLDWAEMNPVETYKVNTFGVINLWECCKELSIPLIHIGTMMEDSQPQCTYVKSKKYATTYLCENSNAIIVKLGALFGGGINNDKKIVGKAVRKATNKELIKVVKDMCIPPVYAKDVAEFIVTIARKGEFKKFKVLNVGNSIVGQDQLYISLMGFILKILKLCKEEYTGDYRKILPVNKFETIAPRQKKFGNPLEISLRSWEEALEEYLITEF